MRFDWSSLGRTAPTALVEARLTAHHAAQWASRAARANLPAAVDDSHSAFEWEPRLGALVSQPLAAGSGRLRVGLRIADLSLLLSRDDAISAPLALDGKTNRSIGSWLDAQLAGEGLKPATSIEIPYTIDPHPVARGAEYRLSEASKELARWYDASSETLAALRASLAGSSPPPSALRCWPHHFDLAMLVPLDAGGGEAARSVGIGVSPGDASYAQPYAYVSPWPYPDRTTLPPAPPPGHWHSEGFLAIVATGQAILSLREPGSELLAFVTRAYQTARASLGG
jgi:hypothetical protein